MHARALRTDIGAVADGSLPRLHLTEIAARR
jgi:hypothetical protein